MKIRPLDDRIVVKPMDAEERTPGGLVLPDTAKEKPQTGEIIAVGPGSRKKDGTRAEMAVSVGDHVIYGKYSGTEIKVEGEEVKILRESDILGRLE